MYIFTYIFLLLPKSPLKYIYIYHPQEWFKDLHAQPHKTHTSARVRRCRSHYFSPPCFWGRRVPPRIPLVFKTRWQLTVCDGQREGTINDARSAFTHELDSFFFFSPCVVGFFFLFLFLHPPARSACGKSLMNQLLSHRVEWNHMATGRAVTLQLRRKIKHFPRLGLRHLNKVSRFNSDAD